MWILYSILSSVFASLMAVFIKIGIKDINPYLALLIRTFIVLIFLIVITLINKSYKDIYRINKSTFLWFIVISIVTFLTWLFYFLAIKKGKVTTIVAIDKVGIILTCILSTIFLNEELTYKMIIGACLLIIGALLMIK